MYIVYSSYEEVIVTTIENEHQAINEYFTEGNRDLDAFDREEIDESAVSVTPRLSAE